MNDKITFNENTSKALIDLHITKLVESLSVTEDKGATNCLREFMATKTYDLLCNPNSYLCLESPVYIMDMLEAERQGNWDKWLEV
jgi:hypothetical protein